MSRDHQFHEPTTYEAGQWRELAQLARACATGERKSWRELQRAAIGVGRCRVFGINDRGNVCNLLIQCALDAAQSVAPSRYFDELHRLADEVLKRCEAWAEVRQAQVSRG
ncbi:hypothetical protein [Asticcacaulis excentricus]|uniref:Uncharacterized protein n=1 Tax=Asticcacaulis excentricus (strain ATCC 15261 / DSM 4724 / KCTC 12464 / NCIMB 9791 / VKM B-1370 / CB 48) TaxID=573065 RepID=E8RPP2_ASTEC|nr:hypothetical protein [Asticcacaulis excentricus]ADU12019.1 hypothetical protein Astex_0321 [Asticcacaulis excentricus CB 48]